MRHRSNDTADSAPAEGAGGAIGKHCKTAAFQAFTASVPRQGRVLDDVSALERFADAMAQALEAELEHRTLLISLRGDLGAGKTTLARALLHRLGEPGPVKSPTYTLFETYRIAGREVAHVDLYRIADPEELELIGFDELLERSALVLVEWACNGGRWMPAADLTVSLAMLGGEGRQLFLDLADASSTL